MMTRPAHDTAIDWIAAVHEVIVPHLHQAPYGHLRTETTTWAEGGGTVSNLAIVYEVPGGSTNQLNISYSSASGCFTYIALDAHAEQTTPHLPEVLAMVRDAVARIPDLRCQRLIEEIDRWAAAGMGQRDLLQQLSGLLQMDDLRGGAITPPEMKAGIAHILAHYRGR